MAGFDDIRLRELRFLERLAVNGSITATARELGVPKPTASRWLAGLEAKVGQPLVHRTTRHLALTERGQAFLERIRDVLAAADAAQRVVQAGEPGGTLRISVPVPLGRLVGGHVVADYRRRLPGVRLEVRMQNERVDLVRDNIDVAIRGGRLPDSELVARKLASVPLWLYASARFAGADPEGLPLIAAVGDAALLARLRAWRREPAALLDDRTAVADALCAGAGMGVLPAFLGEPPVAAGDLVRLEETPLTTFPVHALYLPSQRDDPRIRVLVDAIDAHLEATLGGR